MMGGVDTDIDGATLLPGLYAAGETACVSLNGANRLGSNSLTECLVFGARAGRNAIEYARGVDEVGEAQARSQTGNESERLENLRGRKKGGENISQIRREMHGIMEAGCGVYRDHEGLERTVRELAQLKGRVADLGLQDESKVFNTELTAALELQNMLDVAEAVAIAARGRKESRGAHAGRDFPTRNDQEYLHHSLVHLEPSGPRLDKKSVTLGTWEPEERKY